MLSRTHLAGVVLLTALAVALPSVASAAPGDPTSPQREARNYSKQSERASTYLKPGVLKQQTRQGLTHFAGGLTEQTNDPGRLFLTDLCWSKSQGCGGDPRLAHWKQRGYGLVRRVLFTGRDGSTISGHVWATRRGPASRPLIVITPGSVQATEEMYWWAAQTLAKDGYVVLTRDPQNQGRSDTFGAGNDTMDGVPAQSTGVTFYDHTEDSIDFALSRPFHSYCPRDSRKGISHCAKQRRRVKAGKDTAYDPFWRMVDRKRIGLAGHSYGAGGVSWVGQQDHRVDAVVAWDNLCDPSLPPRQTLAPGKRVGPASGLGTACPVGGLGHPKPRVPSLGLSADYFLTPTPYTSRPNPGAKSAASRRFSKAGVDTGEIVIRGGTHYEFSYIPTPTFGATLRGIDEADWYTTAWFDRYVKGHRSATRRLLTNRWRHDRREAAVDATRDGNMYSYYYRSRLDLGHDGGRRVRCENLRRGCAALTSRDGWGPSYSYLRIATSPDS